MVDCDTEGRRTYILQKIIHHWNKEEADNAAVYFAICSGCIGTRVAKFLLSFWQDQNYACSIQ